MKPSTGLLLALVLAAASPARGAIYKWIDNQGGVHYSQQPPAGNKAQELPPAPPPAQDPDKVRSELKSRVDAMQKQQDAQDKTKQKKRDKEQHETQRADNCRHAQANLQVLTSGGRKRYRLPDGTVTYLSPEQTQARIKQAQQQIDKSCGPPKGE
ncbi:MAG: DUF4124 domain-containing protein [Gammaproteobacteria bacterium]